MEVTTRAKDACDRSRGKLRAAFTALTTDPYRVRANSAIPTAQAQTDVDPRNQRFRVTTTAGDRTVAEYVGIGDDLFARRVTSGQDRAQSMWYHLDPGRVRQTPTTMAAPAGDVTRYPEAAAGVSRPGPGALAGTLDLTKAGVKPDLLSRYTDGGRAVPFQAGTDPATGWIRTFTFTVPADANRPVLVLRMMFQP